MICDVTNIMVAMEPVQWQPPQHCSMHQRHYHHGRLLVKLTNATYTKLSLKNQSK